MRYRELAMAEQYAKENNDNSTSTGTCRLYGATTDSSQHTLKLSPCISTLGGCLVVVVVVVVQCCVCTESIHCSDFMFVFSWFLSVTSSVYTPTHSK